MATAQTRTSLFLPLLLCVACAPSTRSVTAALPLADPRRMVRIPGGSFVMGSSDEHSDTDERPPHPVSVASFDMDVTEVTVQAYAACVDAGACSEPVPYGPRLGQRSIFCNWKHPENRALHPVNCVSWYQASAYCAHLARRLPTEEEWEYAARRDGRRYPWGNEPPTTAVVNACGPDCAQSSTAKRFETFEDAPWGSDGFAESSPVGSFPAGASQDGLLDLAGNVSEWTSSHFSESYASPRDDAAYVHRGGSWFSAGAPGLRATYRLSDPPENSYYFVGFRCAR